MMIALDDVASARSLKLAVVEMLILNLFLLIAIGQLKLLNEMKFVSFNFNYYTVQHAELFNMGAFAFVRMKSYLKCFPSFCRYSCVHRLIFP